ncbi:hypothetical protein T484DRAFT_1952060 [Baffinella frigidus]|nr:hypothetical protein T484DRAFT_1952060 [Cryptophyta sp. CCMP2293]
MGRGGHGPADDGHSHENGDGHAHGNGHAHGHTHEHMDDAGAFDERDLPGTEKRNFKERSFTVGIGGPVGSGKTALVLSLCRHLRDSHNIAVTGGCPHAAIREDISGNLVKLEELTEKFHPEVLLLESGGDNLAANFSRELSDFTIYTDLADAVGADLKVMDRDAKKMRGDGPTIFAQVKNMVGIPEIATLILDAVKGATGAVEAATKKQKTEK